MTSYATCILISTCIFIINHADICIKETDYKIERDCCFLFYCCMLVQLLLCDLANLLTSPSRVKYFPEVLEYEEIINLCKSVFSKI